MTLDYNYHHLKALIVSGLLLFFSSLVRGQQVAFPDANLRAEILNEYGVTVKGANNAAVPVAGTNKIDFSKLNASDPDLLTHGVNGVTQIFADFKAPINDLSGLEQLTNLTFLDVQGNSALSFPAGFTNLPLQNLDLSHNNLAALPASFSSLTSLASLMISDNSFISLPVLPPNLTYLETQHNNLASLPSLPVNLTFLEVKYNSLSSLPSLPASLTFLDLEHNILTSLPPLPNSLTNLNLNSNAFNSLPALPSALDQLSVGNNNLTNLPALPAGLTHLYAGFNGLSSLPDLPPNLVFLSVIDNHLTSLPSFPATLANAYIFNNNLTFEDIEPFISFFDLANGGADNYSNQANFSITPATKNVNVGQSLNLTAAGFITGSINNRYQWFRDGNAVSQVSASPAFSIASFTQADAGSYVCAVTNTVVTGLTISSDPVVVSVGSGNPQIVNFPDANLRAAILNQYGGATQGVNNYYGAVPVAGTTNIDFSGLRSILDPAVGINGVTEVYADFLPAQINDFSGIEQLPSLNLLDVQGYSSFQVPASFGAMPLKYLTLSNDNLTSLPNNFINAGSLRALNISHNNFTSVPGIPTTITDLDMGYNSLTGLPAFPVGLTSLSVNNNNLTCLPLLPNGLNFLKANNNNLTSLPSLLPTELFYLYVANNALTSLPDLANVSILEAQNNNLTSLPTLPTILDALTVDHNNLTSLPSLPFYLFDLKVSHNHLTSLPPFPAELKGAVDVSYNNLTFEDLEPIISHFGLANNGSNSYSNQANFSITPASRQVTTGQPLNLTASGFIAGGVNNRYQWFKDGTAVSQGSTSPVFSIANVALTDAGSYVCAVTNTVVTGLTISSDPVVVTVSAPLQQWNQYDNTNSPIADASKITSITVGSDNSVWIAAGDVVYRRKADDTWTQYPVATTTGLVYASVIAAGPNGLVWVGANDQSSGLSRFDGTTWQQVQIPQSIVDTSPYYPYLQFTDIELTDNSVWVATNFFVLKFDAQAWTKLNYQNKVTSPTSLSWDAAKQELWISNNCAPEGNVFKYALGADTWTEYQMGNSVCAHAVQAVNGGALVGSCNYSTIVAIRNDEVQPYVNSECISVGTVVVDPANNTQAWFGSENTFPDSTVPYGLILFDGNSVIKNFNNVNSSMKGNGVSGIAAQQNGNTITLWLITYLYNNVDFSFKSFLETYTYNIDGLASQTITFNALPAKNVADAPFTLSATASSGLSVTYKSSNSSVATIAGSVVNIVGSGTTTITASQAGNNTYAAAPDQVQYLVVNPVPCATIPKPTVTSNFANAETPLLVSSATTGNQWFLNGTAINGAIQPTYTVTQTGMYTVQTKQGTCMSSLSDGVSIIVTGLEKAFNSGLYPNPVSNELTFTASGNGAVSIYILDILGKPVKQFSYPNGGEVKIDVTDLSTGSYVLKAFQQQQVQNLHFIKK